MDSLSVLLQDLDLHARVFFSGGICGLQHFENNEQEAHIHFLKSGCMTLETDSGHKVMIDKPSVVFIPSGSQHKINMPRHHDCELVCATIRFKPHQKRVLVDNLPKFLCISVDETPLLHTTTQWIFDEAFGQESGRDVMIDRLCDVFMLYLLRYVVTQNIVSLSDIAAHSHPQLNKVITALNDGVEQYWSVEKMADIAAMSRSKFSALFKETLGQAPMDYLTDIRIDKAKSMLLLGRPMAIVAEMVGYEDMSSLSRVFKKRLGETPRDWLKQEKSA